MGQTRMSKVEIPKYELRCFGLSDLRFRDDA